MLSNWGLVSPLSPPGVLLDGDGPAGLGGPGRPVGPLGPLDPGIPAALGMGASGWVVVGKFLALSIAPGPAGSGGVVVVVAAVVVVVSLELSSITLCQPL